jgi:hypothetical protein
MSQGDEGEFTELQISQDLFKSKFTDLPKGESQIKTLSVITRRGWGTKSEITMMEMIK